VGLPTSQISSKQAQRVAKLNLKNIIPCTLGIKADPATYFTKYMYPRKGISLLCEGWPPRSGAGNEVCLESPAVRVEREGDRVVRGTKPVGKSARSTAIILLSTLPLPALVAADHALPLPAKSRRTPPGCAIAA
jgi:hypothetical protein